MCIYLGNNSKLVYNSGEHIIPAGLGGIMKLPIDYVSTEFNNESSKYEQTLLRSSILSLPRQILGPGKRGTFSESKATKSKVNVFKQQNSDSYSLGYIMLNKPFEIPHIVLNNKTGKFLIGLNATITDEKFKVFKEQLINYDKLKIRYITFKELDENTFILGIESNIEENYNCFIASRNGNLNPFTHESLSKISTRLTNKNNFSHSESYHIKTHQNASINDDYYKCCAKIAFNCLAFLKGKDYAMKTEFDSLKKWLINSKQSTDFVNLNVDLTKEFQSKFPENSHYILITKIKNSLIANVTFYNHFSNSILLSDSFADSFDIDGFICDWKNKKEYTFHEYLHYKTSNL